MAPGSAASAGGYPVPGARIGRFRIVEQLGQGGMGVVYRAVYAHGEEDGYLYIASQLIVDVDLGRLIRTAGVPPLVDALSVIEQVASGLADAHEAGLVHRDRSTWRAATWRPTT